MTKIIITFVLIISQMMTAQTQFEQKMGQAMGLWGAGKPAEATALLERIAAVETENWLPNYYVVLINTTEAFKTKDLKTFRNLVDKAQSVLDAELLKDPKNVELMVLQAMVLTAWVAFEPGTYGMTYSGKIMGIYAQAEKLAPENPRVVMGKTEYEMGSARYFGTDLKPLCAKMQYAIELFATFKPQTAFHPSWGLDRAEKALENCK
jgi:hypothetical protein